MPTIYLQPGDFSTAQAALILDYLNSASDAQAIAARIELEDELDIGEGLAARLIQAREQLGGRFDNLQQVYDVAYIGPERFTEIAVALLDLHLPNAAASMTLAHQALLDEVTRLRNEVAALRVGDTAGAALNSAKRVQFKVLQENVFLGQHLTLEVYAYDVRTQRPLVDQSITLSTNWGILQYQQGYIRQQDAVIEATTDIQGMVRVRLRSPTYETLTQEQQLALEAALQTLDASAPTPESIRAQLQTLVAQYRLENNLALRKAIDIYFNTQKIQIIESVNRRFLSDAWGFHHALISAYLHLPDGSTELGHARGDSNGFVASLSTVKVRLKDWVAAWYQTYLDDLASSNQFVRRVQALSSNEGGRLVNGVLSEISRWSLAESGVAGSIAAEKSTESAVHQFLANDIQALPESQQLQLYSALSVAVRPTAVTQLGTLQAVADTQSTLVDEISNRVGNVEDISSLAGTLQQGLDNFTTRMNTFESGLGQFNTNLGDFNTRYNDFDTRYASFNTQVTEFNANLGTFNTDLGNFNNSHAEYNSRVAGLRTDIVDLQNSVNRISPRTPTRNP